MSSSGPLLLSLGPRRGEVICHQTVSNCHPVFLPCVFRSAQLHIDVQEVQSPNVSNPEPQKVDSKNSKRSKTQGSDAVMELKKESQKVQVEFEKDSLKLLTDLMDDHKKSLTNMYKDMESRIRSMSESLTTDYQLTGDRFIKEFEAKLKESRQAREAVFAEKCQARTDKTKQLLGDIEKRMQDLKTKRKDEARAAEEEFRKNLKTLQESGMKRQKANLQTQMMGCLKRVMEAEEEMVTAELSLDEAQICQEVHAQQAHLALAYRLLGVQEAVTRELRENAWQAKKQCIRADHLNGINEIHEEIEKSQTKLLELQTETEVELFRARSRRLKSRADHVNEFNKQFKNYAEEAIATCRDTILKRMTDRIGSIPNIDSTWICAKEELEEKITEVDERLRAEFVSKETEEKIQMEEEFQKRRSLLNLKLTQINNEVDKATKEKCDLANKASAVSEAVIGKGALAGENTFKNGASHKFCWNSLLNRFFLVFLWF